MLPLILVISVVGVLCRSPLLGGGSASTAVAVTAAAAATVFWRQNRARDMAQWAPRRWPPCEQLARGQRSLASRSASKGARVEGEVEEAISRWQSPRLVRPFSAAVTGASTAPDR
ncbi:unnamed protein product [Schistocephalus solidus]|uniref:Secreted protein n=1 Tax=Schistocephalus solidus TaxID=70667 RepID=A0A183SQY9_SCHSO|nr:unnamed protein product [Schistocephalus solidus]